MRKIIKETEKIRAENKEKELEYSTSLVRLNTAFSAIKNILYEYDKSIKAIEVKDPYFVLPLHGTERECTIEYNRYECRVISDHRISFMNATLNNKVAEILEELLEEEPDGSSVIA